MLSEERIYYVYAYLDPRKSGLWQYEEFSFTNEPFYIGKGKNDRLNEHMYEYKYDYNPKDRSTHRKLHKINKITKKGLSPIILKVKEDLNEEEAYELERLMIDHFRKLDEGGILTNYRDGGEHGGSLGIECRERISETLSGRKQDPEIVEKRTISLKKTWKEKRTEILEKREKTYREKGIVVDQKEKGRKISKTKKGNVVIPQEQRDRSSCTLKKKYASGEIVVWNKGKKLHYLSANRRYVLKIDQITGKILEEFSSINAAIEASKESVHYFITNGKPFKGHYWRIKEEEK